jgi:hypothetical protein
MNFPTRPMHCGLSSCYVLSIESKYFPQILVPQLPKEGIVYTSLLPVKISMRIFFFYQHSVTHMPIAGQQLGKHIPESYALNNRRTSIAR